MKDDKNIVVVRVYEKLLLTINEAAAYSNIGINKISEMLNDEIGRAHV